jgi:D-alanyl-lipoteichoic acid acyltransferase DltB (MBOAT superfamily)
MTSSVPFLSVLFLGLAIAAVVAVGSCTGRLRLAVFAAANVTMLLAVFLGVRGTISTLVFVALGWAIVKASVRFTRWGLLIGSVLFIALFVWMRNYDFLRWLLPDTARSTVFATLGLSFLLFKILHVAIEAKSDTLGPITFTGYLNYCLNFTTFAMGPIQRFQDFRAQWNGEKAALPATLEAHLDAVNRILFGLFRVYVLGALLQPFIMTYDAGTETAELSSMLVQIYAFYFFLYFNFGGYCDIVIGFGSLMGVRPPENFDKPFIARNVSEFWQRQHRSLTLWLTDYVFSPSLKRALSSDWLRGRTIAAVAVALTLTMLVSGLWHGTTAGFVLFGLAHGAFLVIYHLWDSLLVVRFGRKRVAVWRRHPVVAALGIFITFNAVAFAFVFFQLGATKGLTLFRNVFL